MDRLISEQEVLDVIASWFVGVEQQRILQGRIKAIPSAEPYKLLSDGTLVIETPSYRDVRRVLLEHGTWCSGFFYLEGDEPEWVSITDEPQWIPVSERLPRKDEYGDVLVTYVPSAGTLWTTVLIAQYSDLMGIAEPSFHIGAVGKKSFQNITNQVTAWMPLPKEYKEADG